ncbi:MAG: FoF1 ATP synthase subunit gamma [Actinomycetota bacterium]
MQKLTELKQQIKTVQNIEIMARTMATVAAAKISKVRQRAAGMRTYTAAMRDMIRDQQAYLIRSGGDLESLSPLLVARPEPKQISVFLITGDRGMCGNYNMAANHLCLEFIESQKAAGHEVSLVVKGRKGELYWRKRRVPIVHAEYWQREGVVYEEVERLLAMLTERFISGEADEVHTVYTEFYSPIKRQPRMVKLLPMSKEVSGAVAGGVSKWFYEPSFDLIIDDLLYVYARAQLYDILLESFASEQGARMITMTEATERAEKTLKDCRMQYNRLRREVITIDLLSVLFASRVVEESEPAEADSGYSVEGD